MKLFRTKSIDVVKDVSIFSVLFSRAYLSEGKLTSWPLEMSLYLEFRYCCVIINLDMFYLLFIFLFLSLYYRLVN